MEAGMTLKTHKYPFNVLFFFNLNKIYRYLCTCVKKAYIQVLLNLENY